MTVICEHSATCNASLYCTHAREHQPIMPWKKDAVPKTCDHNHACDFTREVVKCEEAK